MSGRGPLLGHCPEWLTERQWCPRSDTSFPALLQGSFQEVERFLTGQGLNTNLVANKVSQAGTVAGEPAGAVQGWLCGRPANAADTIALMSCCKQQLRGRFHGSSQALCCIPLWQCCRSGATSQHEAVCRCSLKRPSQLWPAAVLRTSLEEPSQLWAAAVLTLGSPVMASHAPRQHCCWCMKCAVGKMLS